MFNWPLLINRALLTGLGLSLVLVAIMGISMALAPDMWVGDYPPDIKQKYGPMSRRAARLRPYVAAPFFLAFFLIPILGLLALRAKVGLVPFVPALVYAFVALLVFNTFDLLILDWLLFCTIRPRMMVLPGTQGMAGYRNYRFHFVGFFKGLAFCAVGGLVIAALWLVLQWIIT